MTDDARVEVAGLLPCPMGCVGEVIGGEHENAPVYCKVCFLRAISPKAWNTRPTPEPSGDEVECNIKPWADYHGDLPDYDHPLRCVFESGCTYAVELLAKELGVEQYQACDGTEEFDGDLGGTMFNIVLAAMPEDEHGDPMHPSEVRTAIAALRPDTDRGRVREENEALRNKLRMIVAHGTGEPDMDADASVNDICVAISAYRNKVFAGGKEAAFEEAARVALHYARNAYGEGLSEDVVLARYHSAYDIFAAICALNAQPAGKGTEVADFMRRNACPNAEKLP